MKISVKRGVALVVCSVMMLCLAATVGFAQERSRSAKRMKDAQRHARDAARVFEQVMGVKEKTIPQELLDRAEAIAVFPGVVKAAFIVGGRGGQGLIVRRQGNGWSAPAFFNLGGGSFGPQIGAQKTDYVLLIMNEGGLKGLLEDKFEIGGEAGVAAGPVGREAAASTNVTLDAGILSYSRTKGAFIGAALKGAVISPDNDLNASVYGMKARDILANDSQVKAPAGVAVFTEVLRRYSSR